MLGTPRDPDPPTPPGARRLVWAIAYAVAHELSTTEAAAVLGEAARDVASWSAVEELLAAHRCEALGYHLLKEPEIRAACDPPAATLATLRGRYSAAFVHGAVEPTILARLLAALDGVGVRALPVKGLIVGAWLYPEPTLREHMDIDLLVSGADTAAVDAVLTELGYERASQPPLFPGEAAGTVDYGHPDGGPHVDLSFDPLRLFWRQEKAGDPFDGWWARRQEVGLGSGAVPTLGPEDQFVHLARHLQFHDFFRVNSFLDVLLLLRRHGDTIDWERIGVEARALGIAGGLYRTLELARRSYDVSAPPAAWRALRPNRAIRALHRTIWDDDLAAVRERPAVAGNPIVPRFLSLRGPHPLAGLALHAVGPNRGRTAKYLLQRIVPPPGWFRAAYGEGDGGQSYPALLRRHWGDVGRLRREVRERQEAAEGIGEVD